MRSLYRGGAVAATLILTFHALTQPAVSAAEPPIIRPGTDGKALPEHDMSESAFTIAVLPDRTTGKPWGIPYLEMGVNELNIMQPDVVFTVGDMVQGYTRSVEHYLNETNEYFSIVDELDAPFYPLPGNHDVISGMRDPDVKTFENLYKKHFGPLYYAVHFEHATVIALYTDEALESRPELSQAQIRWLEGELEIARERNLPVVVMMHKPAWRYRNSNWEPIHDMLAETRTAIDKPVTVIAGHFHSLQRDHDRDGVMYQLIGTCGALIDQHPLAGQLQHLTIVKVFPESNDVRVYHHPLGCTLPDDFVTVDDQNRANRLKSWSDNCEIRTVLEQPLGKRVEGDVVISFRNPIDRAIRVTAELADELPGPAVVEGYGFVSRTQMDIHNPFVTRTDTPFEQIEEPGFMTVQPEQSVDFRLPLRCESQGTMLPPPQINVMAYFTDDQNRDVPIIVRRRVPLQMSYAVQSSPTLIMPVCAWTFSVYDTREFDPQLRVSAQDGSLHLALETFDDIGCHHPVDEPSERVINPMADTVVLRFGSVTKPDAKYVLIEPFREGRKIHRVTPSMDGSDDAARFRGESEPDSPDDWSFQVDETPLDGYAVKVVEKGGTDGWTLEVSLPLADLGSPGETLPFNLYIADNDLTYHTQWRQWAPDRPDAESTITLPGSF